MGGSEGHLIDLFILLTVSGAQSQLTMVERTGTTGTDRDQQPFTLTLTPTETISPNLHVLGLWEEAGVTMTAPLWRQSHIKSEIRVI